MDLNKRAISSRPFMKREVAKSRLICPSGPEATIRYSYIQLSGAESKTHETNELGQICRRGIGTEYIISKLLDSRSGEDVYFVSDDSEGFNESHSLLDMVWLIGVLVREMSAYMPTAAANDVSVVLTEYINALREKTVTYEQEDGSEMTEKLWRGQNNNKV